LFENSIVCLVVFVCCFCHASWGTPRLPVVGCGCCFCQIVVWLLGQIFLIRIRLALVGLFLFGEFDSGSGRTLAACLTHASRTESALRSDSSGERVSNTWVICPALWDKPGKLGLIPNTPCWSHGLVGESFCGVGWARGLSACWWGDGLPRRRRVAGLRGCPATLGLRYGPDSYGRQQWGILHNGRKPDAATPREG
jgi:hypothetical protein